jgi:2-C-methyl-D-erythritol 2,4-cyclodiphosphate synthase
MMNLPFRIGHGYDLHRLTEERKLILGGVELPNDKGLLGHSDADCLIHAIADSILGALALPDIGHYFPDTNPENKNLESKLILLKANQLCKDAGYSINNIDTTIIAEKPKIGPHLEMIRSSLAEILEIESHQIGIKATTNEKLGPVGREEAISCYSVCLLQKQM